MQHFCAFLITFCLNFVALLIIVNKIRLYKKVGHKHGRKKNRRANKNTT